MNLIKDIIVYAILGAIQGFSEPIPISSSGHLVLFQSIFEKLGLMVPQMNDVTFEVIVNTGSKHFLDILLNRKKEMNYYQILDFVCY